WALPLPRSHPDSSWDAIPEPVVAGLLDVSRQRGPVLDPFAGAGTVGIVAVARGRTWIGMGRDPRMARLIGRRLRLKGVAPDDRSAATRSRSPARRRVRRVRLCQASREGGTRDASPARMYPTAARGRKTAAPAPRAPHSEPRR